MCIIVVGGEGRLGKNIVSKLLLKKYDIISVDINSTVKNINNLDDKIKIKAIIDISTPENSLKTAIFATDNKIPLVIGCTGHTPKELDKLYKLSNYIPIFLAYNFSIALQYFYKAIETLSLSKSKKFIIETHHDKKKDAPSGTAKEIMNLINSNDSNVENVFSIRAGNIIGKHSVDFIFDNETINITHDVFSRDVFADGAIKAIEFLIDKQKGLYSMKDLI